MPTIQKQADIVKVKQYVADAKGHKKAIDDTVCEKEESYEAHNRKIKSSIHV